MYPYLLPEMLTAFAPTPDLKKLLVRLLKMPMQDHPQIKSTIQMVRDDLVVARQLDAQEKAKKVRAA